VTGRAQPHEFTRVGRRASPPVLSTIELVFDYLDALNDEQRAAVTHDNGSLRVLAGAGTGKTTTLTTRVAWLLGTGTPPERVLLLTFTRRAAREMLTRTDALIRRSGAEGPGRRVIGGTFHAVAHRTLRRHAHPLGLPDGFSVIDTSDAADVLDLVRDEQLGGKAPSRRFPRKATLHDLYSRAVNTGRPISAVIGDVAPWATQDAEAVAAICKAYVARKRALELLDFDDLLLYWRAAVRDDRLGRQLAGTFDHVLVDEYQDVNAVQVDILCGLRRYDPRLTVVGDDAQAIYSFRAATPRHILDFPQVFPDSTTVLLQHNYRSGQQILDVANAVADDAPEGFRARLHSQRRGPRPQLVRCADTDAEATAVCERILDCHEQGTPLKEQAVLIRAGSHSDLLELELARRHIPYLKYGGLKFLEAAHVKDLLATFRLADNPRDELSWFRLLQLLPGVGPAIARKAITALGLPGDRESAVLALWADAVTVLPPTARMAADVVVTALHRSPAEPVPVHAERLRSALLPILSDRYDNIDARTADLDALVAATADATRLSDVAADLALDPPCSTSDLAGPPVIDEDWLVLSTVHSAKGLEWDIVHVLHAADGDFPSDMSMSTREGLEEERRLFYVALTRARKQLTIYVPLRYHHRPRGRDDLHSYAQPSRFLSPSVQRHLDTAYFGHIEVAPGMHGEPATASVSADLDALWA
jgi:DNA helicase II / ATP-dependent DNA helicase PcrA